MYEFFMFADRKSSALFWIGSMFVIAGVLLHIPMFLMGRDSTAGGLVCQTLSFLALVPAFGTAAAFILVTVLAGFGLTAMYGRETRNRDLRELERAVPQFAAE